MEGWGVEGGVRRDGVGFGGVRRGEVFRVEVWGGPVNGEGQGCGGVGCEGRERRAGEEWTQHNGARWGHLPSPQSAASSCRELPASLVSRGVP